MTFCSACLPENCASDNWGLGEGKEWDEVRSEDAEEEHIAELPPRGHNDWNLVVDQEHREDLGDKIMMINNTNQDHALSSQNKSKGLVKSERMSM